MGDAVIGAATALRTKLAMVVRVAVYIISIVDLMKTIQKASKKVV
jgi:hypothetical protein